MSKITENIHDFPLLVEEIQKAVTRGDRRILDPLLKKVMAHRISFYYHSINARLNETLNDILFKILVLELDEEEDESIETAEMAYVGISNLIKENTVPENLKKRVLLLHYFADFFTDAIIEIFLNKYREGHMLEARNLALECLTRMQIADLIKLETLDKHFVENDEQLCEACNMINDQDLIEQDISEAELMHKVLHVFLMKKYDGKEQEPVGLPAPY